MPTTPHCPRCDYDLQGQLATWHPQGPSADDAHCPTDGLCSECGLSFEWRFAMHPELAGVAWFVECQKSKRTRLSVPLTTIRAWLAPLFWRRIKLETPFKPHRTAWWLLWTTLLFPALISIIAYYTLSTYFVFNPPTAITVVNGVWTNFTPAVPANVEEFFSALYNTNTKLLVDFADPVSEITNLSRTRTWIIAAFISFVGFPLMLFLFPFTRAQSKVRKRHIFRAAAYSLAPIPFIFLSTAISLVPPTTLMMWFPRGSIYNLSYTNLLFSYGPAWRFEWIIALAWFFLWWLCALKIGFRMRDWLAALLAMSAPVIVATVLLISFRDAFLFYFRLW